ncbi:hypothetical protein POM88_022978 [Heracleum sosnowskyi]|uniref:cellulase n=1 Tax=Heracleum sosnowskyi TaxID=360622 RepID=A0AAD8LXH6_9APIA|nr:hypothetical protein POM88_054426 [Heracleum sosnowskyi]KAK1352756.1 hypothetical protein POM88_053187 [Heracleum sosnowskyi]KAK1385243.1 hypothetical protein POM88_022978 [Heracleum sosnowskyi]
MADYFTCSCEQKNDGYNISMTRGALLYIKMVNCLNARLYPQGLLNFAGSQADYILGKNPNSQIFETWHRLHGKNPNVIYGGLVGGPNKNDEFNDDWANHEQTEPTTSATAPLLGVRTFLQIEQYQ